MHSALPQRIVCLTEEPTEVLYALGQQQRIVGISGFTVRPPQARQEKPRVSAFTSAKIDKILALQPDLAIGFSDMQADIAAALIKAGVEVWISNHRSIGGILGYVRRLGALVGAAAAADAYADALERRVDAVRAAAAQLPRRPKVYFEEWDVPAVRDGELHEIKSPLILQPGPAALTDGLDRLQAIIANWALRQG